MLKCEFAASGDQQRGVRIRQRTMYAVFALGGWRTATTADTHTRRALTPRTRANEKRKRKIAHAETHTLYGRSPASIETPSAESGSAQRRNLPTFAGRRRNVCETRCPSTRRRCLFSAQLSTSPRRFPLVVSMCYLSLVVGVFFSHASNRSSITTAGRKFRSTSLVIFCYLQSRAHSPSVSSAMMIFFIAHTLLHARTLYLHVLLGILSKFSLVVDRDYSQVVYH